LRWTTPFIVGTICPVKITGFRLWRLLLGPVFSNYEHLKRLYVWGSPCYVLDPRLQYDKKIPKWEPRCSPGQYLGVSLEHSITVERILNTHTGYVSLQYHVLHDDLFTTVVSTEVPWSHFVPLQWNTFLQTGYERHLEPDFDWSGQLLPAPMLAGEWLMGPERVLRDTLERERRSLQLFVRSQSQRVSAPNTNIESSVRGGTVPTPSNLPVQPSPLEQPSIMSIPTISPIIPITDDPPPLMARSDEDSHSDDNNNDGNRVSVNPGPLPVKTRSGRRVRPANRMNLNAMKVKEMNSKKTNNSQELRNSGRNFQVRKSELES
jgi:hypothetical protein